MLKCKIDKFLKAFLGILKNSVRFGKYVRIVMLYLPESVNAQIIRAECSGRGQVMARITVEDCQERVDNRFLLVQMAIKRVRQYREGYEPLVESRNKEVVTALREIAAGKILPDDMTLFTPTSEDKSED